MSQRLKYLIIAGRFNDMISRSLLEGAGGTFRDAGIPEGDVETIWVPGAYEMPTVAAKAAGTGRYAAVICLGAVIRGDTPHFDYVAGQCAAGLMKVGVDTGVPVIFGVLTTNTVEEALNRAGLKHGNKGADAAAAALSMAKTMQDLERGPS